MEGSEAEDKKRTETICAVLKHPLRVRILEALNEGPRSPSQFVEEGLIPKEHFTSYQQALSLASYHFRELEKEGCLEVIESIPRRGAVEHVYRGLARVFFNDAEFEATSPEDRRELSRISLQGLIARADRAIWEETFDARADRHLTWMPMQLDERGWEEVIAALAGAFGELTQIRLDARDRLAASGEEVVPATVGMLGFESPPPPPLRGD
ncbi:MAG TPA: winged helix-turn-helix domain-containing protein [Solirubrobacterales bacterium]|nr:winged helix-turn-helix domain-containing protein [Solirubrobacterales bacterium]